MTPIADQDHYTTEMHKSLFDKLFFAPLIDSDCILDYGCADGALIRAHEHIFPGVFMIGYDNNKDMIRKARDLSPNWSDAFHTWDWTRVHANVRENKRPAILLSSVMHEVYSYCSEAQIAEFENNVWNSGFKYVVIRDMMHNAVMDRKALLTDVARVRMILPTVMIQEHEEKFGTIENQTSLVHLLLKYRYKENWKREVEENYLSVKLEDFFRLVPLNYKPIHFQHYTLPFVRDRVRDDFGINMVDRTHVQLIFERT